MNFAISNSILLLSLLLLGYHSSSSQESYDQMVRHFDYDHRAPLALKEIKVETRNGVKIHDISYASPLGGRVPAYLVVPQGRGPFAGTIFAHWAMRSSPVRNRNEFLEEAEVLARAGVVSLLIDSSFVRPGVVQDEDILSKRNADQLQQQVIDLRRGVDLLVARRDVDPKRIAYVGHSYNASAGAILAGVDKRLKAFVLMAGSFSDAELMRADDPEVVKWREGVGVKNLDEYLVKYAWLDPGNYIGQAAPAAVLLQFARNDGLLNEQRERYYFTLLSEPKTIKIYDATHALNAEARWDRFEWLRAQLGLKRLPRDVLDNLKQVN
jgi:dienelactone hydrolase